MMNDMSQVIIPRSDQYNAEDFLSGPRTFCIESVTIKAGTEQPVTIKLRDEERFWRPCKSMSKCLVAAWGADANAYIGRSLTLYLDPTVKWGGLAVGGIRISNMTNIERDLVLGLTETKGKRKLHTIRPLAIAEPKPQSTGADWLAKMSKALDGCTTTDAVLVIERRKDVQKALTEWAEDGQDEVRRLLMAAHTRVAVAVETVAVEDDDIFPGDKP